MVYLSIFYDGEIKKMAVKKTSKKLLSVFCHHFVINLFRERNVALNWLHSILRSVRKLSFRY